MTAISFGLELLSYLLASEQHNTPELPWRFGSRRYLSCYQMDSDWKWATEPPGRGNLRHPPARSKAPVAVGL
jgi:hypothetical protein